MYLTDEQRWDKEVSDIRSTKIRDMIIDGILVAVCIYIPISKLKDGLKCHIPIILWLFVQAGVYSLSLIKNLIVLIAIHLVSGKSPKEVKIKIEFLYICIVVNFEICWLIYGNTFIFTSTGMDCMRLNDSTKQLWLLMILNLGFGYFVMILYGLVLLIGVCGGMLMLFFCRRELTEFYQTYIADNPVAERIPYLDVLRGVGRKSFKKVKKEHRTMDSCAICLGDYAEDDEVAELACDERHYFHANCLEDWLTRKLECPLCKSPVQ